MFLINRSSGLPEPTNSINGAVLVVPCDADGVPVGSGQGGAQGYVTDVAASWFTQAATVISLLKLLAAAYVGAGSHAYSYNPDGTLHADAWTLMGTTRTKTYTYTDSKLTGETDWVTA